VNPETGVAQRIIAVPAGRYEGNENGRGGYGAFKPENVWGSNVAVNNDPQRPMLILCHSDGDNFGMLNADAYNANDAAKATFGVRRTLLHGDRLAFPGADATPVVVQAMHAPDFVRLFPRQRARREG
jgi:hypothetical protein